MQRQLLLGSTSPYRRDLLARLRIPFEVAAPEVDETAYPNETPKQLACRLAMAKARAVAARFPSHVVIGSDQVADLDGLALGKPGDHARAVLQLQQMRGQTVVFQTAVAVVCRDSGFAQMDLAQVQVKFRDLSDAQIEAYLLAEMPTTAPAAPKARGWALPCWSVSTTMIRARWSDCH